jgi:predicted nucleic acid-binding protein
VLTALPLPKKISTIEARMIIEESILARVHVVELNRNDYVNAIASVSSKGLASGFIYDALHVEAAKKSSCTRIYTYNIDHFQLISPEDITVARP